MTMIDAPRTEQAEEARVTTIELFFDLVFVFPDPAHRAPG